MPTDAPPKRRPGRPSALTPEVADQIIDLVRKGNYVIVAAQAAGIARSTYYYWLSRAEEYDGAEPEVLEALDDEMALLVWFSDTVKVAEANSEVDLLGEVRDAGTHWQAQMTILERRFPARWRKREEIEHTGSIGGDEKPLTEEERKRDLVAFGMPAATAIAIGPEAVEPPPDA